MNYQGNVFGKVGGKYIPLGKSNEYFQYQWIKLNGIAGEMKDCDCWILDKDGNIFLSPKGEFVGIGYYEYYCPIPFPLNNPIPIKNRPKLYRLINGIGYHQFKEGEVYPENFRYIFKERTVLELVNENPNDWELITEYHQ